jgi:hypothetical protein
VGRLRQREEGKGRSGMMAGTPEISSGGRIKGDVTSFLHLP